MSGVSPVSLEVEDRVAYVRLDRPEVGNRVTTPMMLDLAAAFLRAGTVADVLVLGASGPDFCLGRDQQERVEGMSPRDSLAVLLEANRALRAFRGVTLASVRGRALGFGSGLIVQSDLAIVSENARLGFDEVALGFPPMMVMTYLENMLAPKHARYLLFTGQEVSAVEALAMAMVNRVVADADLEAVVDELVATLRAHDPRAITATKRYLREVAGVPEEARPAFSLDSLTAWAREGAA